MSWLNHTFFLNSGKFKSRISQDFWLWERDLEIKVSCEGCNSIFNLYLKNDNATFRTLIFLNRERTCDLTDVPASIYDRKTDARPFWTMRQSGGAETEGLTRNCVKKWFCTSVYHQFRHTKSIALPFQCQKCLLAFDERMLLDLHSESCTKSWPELTQYFAANCPYLFKFHNLFNYKVIVTHTYS